MLSLLSLTCLAFSLWIPSGCSDRNPCLEKLDAEVKERCLSLSPDECHALRRQRLEKMKAWNALTDDEKTQASEACTL